MKNIFKNSLIIGFLFTLLFAGGCSEDVLDIADENSLDASTYFTTIEKVNLNLTSVYSAVKSWELFGSDYLPHVLQMLPHTSNQDWTGTIGWNETGQNEVLSNSTVVAGCWSGWYRLISRSNDFIANAKIYKESNFIKPGEEAEVDEMLGQAYFLRAYANFSIVRLWGEGKATETSALVAPLFTEVAASNEDMQSTRATVGEFYDQIISDFLLAEELLPDSWDSDNAARVTSYAAKGFLGKVYMYKEDYPTAKPYLEEVVNGPFSLVSSDKYNGLFHGEEEFSSESIWEINFATDMETHVWNGGTGSQIALMMAPKGTGWSNVWPHDVNVRRFGSDPRLHVNALEPGVDYVVPASGIPTLLEKYTTDEEDGLGWSYKKYVPLDYSVYTTNQNYGANVFIMRLADVYLLYAETLNVLGEDVTASEYMNKVRRRAYAVDTDTPDAAVDYTGLTGTVLRDSIREERFRELFAEGQRWFDIVRWGIAKEESDKYERIRSGNIVFDDPKDNYLPIPLVELEANPTLTPSTDY
ncbi:RagB/SusD family nutrient uptake outer membrane protein [Maribacter sp. ANRC-HE7]|uniref:RagB/SusD family nutrient uptake outer membrane protein n=1 Tax=Maribacter aquimaris TaxID=2737171 RepID=A0ABR7V3F8_9FLAO|nr:RagB/SusD family nutrient uptake outer membrane protein [Maribacter aquimaris]MBD0777846.1 RagB/SusD family nutrient uptake outer membrane protein [Maribacter aquimaris]